MDNSRNLDKIPVAVLRPASLEKLSGRLNVYRIIPTEDGLPRDWRGLAHLIGLNSADTEAIGTTSNPTESLIKCWSKGNMKRLQEILEEIGRFDVVDDTKALFEKDIEVYLSQSTVVQLPEAAAKRSDYSVLTVHDVARAEKGLGPQQYDAFLLFADEDVDFAMEIVHQMEQNHNMTICLRDHLVGGVTFEHDAVAKLVAERCRRLLLVVSPEFLQSPSNKFVVTFAQAIGIDRRERKVIPIIYKKCTLPPELSYYFALKYYLNLPWDFWGSLQKSIAPSDGPSPKDSSPWMSHTSPSEPAKIPLSSVEEKLLASPLSIENTKEAEEIHNDVEKVRLDSKEVKSTEEKGKNPLSKAYKFITKNKLLEKRVDESEEKKEKKKKKKGLFGKKKAVPLLA